MDMTLMEFLEKLSKADGNEAAYLIEQFQLGWLTVEGIGADYFN